MLVSPSRIWCSTGCVLSYGPNAGNGEMEIYIYIYIQIGARSPESSSYWYLDPDDGAAALGPNYIGTLWAIALKEPVEQ